MPIRSSHFPVSAAPRRNALRLALALALAAAGSTPGTAQPQPQASGEPRWTAAWAAAAQDYAQSDPGPAAPPLLSLGGKTIRQRIQPQLAGSRLRVRFSNAFGKAPLHIAAASVARSTGGDAIAPGSLRMLRFEQGRRDITLAPGAEAWSDPVAFATDARQPLAVSFHLDRATAAATVHRLPQQASFIAPGRAVAAPRLPAAQPSAWNHVVTGLDIQPTAGQPGTRVAVAFGDSITEGTSAADDTAPRPYPERLATRLAERGAAMVVLNAGIGGNRLLVPRSGPSALARFERDVLSQSGVTHAIVLIGINDIGFGTLPGGASALPPQLVASAEQLVAGLRQLIERARRRGVKVLLGTLLPIKGSGYWSEENEARRQVVNRWIRARQRIDRLVTVADFDAALRDPNDPQALHPRYDSGDHLHPSAAGNAAMAAVIDIGRLLD